MATVNKNFKIKHGLVVEGTTGTINGEDILTKKQADEDYIIALAGGGATSANEANKVVKRDSSGNFAAGTITADLTGDVTGNLTGNVTGNVTGDLTGDVTGTVSDISNHNTDALSEGTTNKYYTDGRVKDVLTGSTQTNISITNVGGELHITAENGVADSDTDDLAEGTTNKYFTDTRAKDAVSAALGTGIEYVDGSFDVQIGDGLSFGGGIIGNGIQIDRATVDGWYDANGAAASAQSAAEDYADNLINDASNSSTEVWSAYKTSTEIGLAESDANAYTDTRETAITTAYQTYADQAETDANSYTDAEIVTALTTAQGYANTAEANANAYTDNAVSGLNWKQSVNLLYDAAIPVLSGSGASQLIVDGHDPLGDADSGYRVLITQSSNAGIYVFNSTSGNWTLTRAEDGDAFGELIGAAVYVMEGTQYGSTSWVQSNHYITDFTGQSWTQFSGQGSVTAGTGIIVDGLEVSVDTSVIATQFYADDAVGTHSDYTSNVHGVTGDVVGTSDTQTLTNKTIDGNGNTIGNIGNASLVNSSITINGNATSLGDSVTLDTDDVQEGSNEYFTQARARGSFSSGNAINYNSTTGEIAVDASQLDSDDIAEGITNQYFTNARVKNVLTSATQNNIVIEEVSGQLIITAENGVDDSTTDDLAEGATNHYFTDGRAATAAADLLVNAIKSNITITGNGSGLTITAENGVADSTTDDLAEGTTNKYFTDSRAVTANTGLWDTVGSASTAQSNAETFATNAINALDTDDIEEGVANRYFTDQRALDATVTAYEAAGAVSAHNIETLNVHGIANTADLETQTGAQAKADNAETAANSYTDSLIGDMTVNGTPGNTVTDRIASAVSDLVDGAPELLDTLNELAEAIADNPNYATDVANLVAGKQDTLTAGDNIDITGATISVTGLDTNDVSEGTNLYFTDARAVDALEAVVPNFTEVDINSVATQVAATGSATGSTSNTVYSFAKADYRSAKFLVKIAYGTHTEISEVLLTLDTSDNIAITEYAIVGTNGSLSTVSAEVSGANVNLLVNPANTSTVTVMGTLLA